jgi:hypothetical protein
MALGDFLGGGISIFVLIGIIVLFFMFLYYFGGYFLRGGKGLYSISKDFGSGGLKVWQLSEKRNRRTKKEISQELELGKLEDERKGFQSQRAELEKEIGQSRDFNKDKVNALGSFFSAELERINRELDICSLKIKEYKKDKKDSLKVLNGIKGQLKKVKKVLPLMHSFAEVFSHAKQPIPSEVGQVGTDASDLLRYEEHIQAYEAKDRADVGRLFNLANERKGLLKKQKRASDNGISALKKDPVMDQFANLLQYEKEIQDAQIRLDQITSESQTLLTERSSLEDQIKKEEIEILRVGRDLEQKANAIKNQVIALQSQGVVSKKEAKKVA